MARAAPASMVGRTLLSILVVAAAACGSPGYVYAPSRAMVSRDGQIYTKVGLPAAQGRGEVRIASQGVRRVSSSTGAQVDALLVRMIVTNESAHRPWSIDTRQQLLQTPTGVRTPPLLVQSKGAEGPVVSVGCHDRIVVDLYYVMPPSGLASLPGFDLMWQVNTGDRLVSQTTEFDRVQVQAYGDTELVADAPGVAWGYWPDRPVVVLRDSSTVIAQRPLRDEPSR